MPTTLVLSTHDCIPSHLLDTIIQDSRLKPIQQVLMLKLLRELQRNNAANDIHQNFLPLTIKTICQWLDQGEKTVRLHVHRLTELGYIEEYGIPGLNPERPILKGVTFLPEAIQTTHYQEDNKVSVESNNLSQPLKPTILFAHEQPNNENQNVEAAWQLLEPPVGKNSTPQANINDRPSETKSSHDQIIGSDKDQIKSGFDDLIRNHQFEILKNLINTRDLKKINQGQLKYIMEKFLKHGFYLHNGIFMKQELIECLKNMQSEMNNQHWKTEDLNHRLNTIQNRKIKQLQARKSKIMRQIGQAA